mmetsp:Transcript_26062/g.68488  ORF Transcript_26062/g.68488 Transcript_26062/m.68488 type:complete len:307 (-) Transcript_26062:164-1084(-)
MATRDKDSPSDEFKRIDIDALVMLQIMKHCKQHVPYQVTGVLLGLDIEDTLQVTHSYGHIQKGEDQVRVNDEESELYSYDMLRKLRDVNVDSNTIGWYQTTHLGQFLNDQMIECQYQYQLSIPKSILLVYDPLQSVIGKPAFKAVQLTAEFMSKQTLARESQTTTDFSCEMFKEIPIAVHSPAIIEAFLVDWALADIDTTTQLDTLDVENQHFLERNVQLLIGSMEELMTEQRKIRDFEVQAARNQQPERNRRDGRYRMPQPRQLDTMILSQQIQKYCKQINNFAGDSFGKIYLLSNKPSGAAGIQ